MDKPFDLRMFNWRAASLMCFRFFLEELFTKNNFQLFPYLTVYKCRVCNAQTKFTHKYHKNPSEKVSVSKGVLLENGEGERKSENFSMSN